MPFKSKSQAYFLKINKPDLYKEWKRKYGSPIEHNPSPDDGNRPKRDKRPIGLIRNIDTP